jgi:hypothetical protein
MSNIVKGVVMNNKYLLLYKEYMLNSMFQLTNSNNRARANYKGCCDDCDGSCVSGVSSGRHFGNGHDGKYKQVNIFNNALALPSPSALVVVKSSVPPLTPLCSKLCSDNIHNDCICL